MVTAGSAECHGGSVARHAAPGVDRAHHCAEGEEATGYLVAALDPHRSFDPAYQGFVAFLTAQVAAGVVARADALAEIDRAKTAFFSNVSHEFHTPLTLMLGPLEDARAAAEPVSPGQRERLEIAHRNALRLLRLVNSLLDFSRIEAGRVEASYLPTDLAALTADLASSLRLATGKAGLHLHERNGALRLAVRDTGIGIPASQIENLFDRFHRVEGARGRSFEGSGIGLALVPELVKLHKGGITVESEEGHGTAFRVTIPLSTGHSPYRIGRNGHDLAGANLCRGSTALAARRRLAGCRGGM